MRRAAADFCFVQADQSSHLATHFRHFPFEIGRFSCSAPCSPSILPPPWLAFCLLLPPICCELSPLRPFFPIQFSSSSSFLVIPIPIYAFVSPPPSAAFATFLSLSLALISLVLHPSSSSSPVSCLVTLLYIMAELFGTHNSPLSNEIWPCVCLHQPVQHVIRCTRSIQLRI